MIRTLELVAGLFALCAVLTGAVRALAPRDPPPRVVALLPDPACDAPCWQGLHPGAIAPAALQAWFNAPPPGWSAHPYHLRGAPPGFDNWEITAPGGTRFYTSIVRFRSPYVDRLMLFAPGLALGDVLLAFSAPDYITLQAKPDIRGDPAVTLRLVYSASNVTAESVITLRGGSLGAALPIQQIDYEALPAGPPPDALPWDGFARLHTQIAAVLAG